MLLCAKIIGHGDYAQNGNEMGLGDSEKTINNINKL